MFLNKEDFEQSISRIHAWFSHEVQDRVPIRFAAHNAEYTQSAGSELTAEQWKNIWFDTEQVIDRFINSIANKTFLAETFPVFWPNLGPDVYAAFYGCDLTYGDITSWSHPCVKTLDDLYNLQFSLNNEYFKKLEELTRCALEKSEGRYLVGYTDLHPGMDCVAAWRGPEQLCFDLLEDPNMVRQLISIASKDFNGIYDHFDEKLKKHSRFSVTWMGIPVDGKFYIPSCDFATMMSPRQFEEFALPAIQKEVCHTTHNVFHLDGKGVARHIDSILAIPEIAAIQWVQGVGDDEPIMQWVEFIKKIQNAGKGIVVDLKKEELDSFIEEVDPHGIFLCINETDEAVQRSIIKRVLKW